MDKRADLRKHFANEANQAKSDAMHSERSAQLSSIEGTIVKGFNSVLNQGSGVGKVEITNDKPIKVEMEETGTDKLADAIASLAQLKGKDGQDGYTPKKGVDYYTEKEIKDITDEIFSKVRIPNDGIDGIDGADGKTPVKGIDYYTDDEIKSIISYILGVIPTPKDGIDGKDGKTPAIDYKKIITEVVKKIPKPKDGKDGKNYSGGGYYGITELIAGAGISIDATDQYRPIITSTGGSSGDVVGPSSTVDSNLAAFDTTTGKLIKDSGVATANIELLSNKVTSLSGASTDTQYPSAKLVYDQLAGKENVGVAAGLVANYLPLAGGTLTGTLNSRSILPSTTATYDLGDITHYYSNSYIARRYFNSTAYIDGAAAGVFNFIGNNAGGQIQGSCIGDQTYNFTISSKWDFSYPFSLKVNRGGTVSEILGGYNADTALMRGNIGIGTTAPTHTLTLPSTSTGIAIYNTADQATNFERLRIYTTATENWITGELLGTGATRPIYITPFGSSTTLGLFLNASSAAGIVESRASTGTAGAIIHKFSGTMSASSGIQYGRSINITLNQSGTGAFTGDFMNIIPGATGSGTKLLADWQYNSVSKFSVNSDGKITIDNTSGASSGSSDYIGHSIATRSSGTFTGSMYGLLARTIVTTNVNWAVGAKFNPYAGSAATVTRMIGMQLIPESGGSGLITDAIGFEAYPYLGSTGSITNYTGISIGARAGAGAGTVTNASGIKISAMNYSSGTAIGLEIADVTTATNSNAIYTGLGVVSLGDTLYMRDKNFQFGTTTGTKIGTGTSQKLAFWNATPVVQPAHIADPAGGVVIDAEARTAINSINALLATLGLTAAS